MYISLKKKGDINNNSLPVDGLFGLSIYEVPGLVISKNNDFASFGTDAF